MFTQAISMNCTKEQYEKYLKDELLKMGYKKISINSWDCQKYQYISNNYMGGNRGLGTIHRDNLEVYNRTYLGSFNAELFLALAAMTDSPMGNYGEYWTCISNNRYFTEGDIYKCIGFYYDKSRKFYDIEDNENGAKIEQLFKYFRKATKEEIMAKFGNEEPMWESCSNIIENLEEIYTAIELLKSNGYKIMRKIETWEEVQPKLGMKIIQNTE